MGKCFSVMLSTDLEARPCIPWACTSRGIVEKGQSSDMCWLLLDICSQCRREGNWSNFASKEEALSSVKEGWLYLLCALQPDWRSENMWSRETRSTSCFCIPTSWRQDAEQALCGSLLFFSALGQAVCGMFQIH